MRYNVTDNINVNVVCMFSSERGKDEAGVTVGKQSKNHLKSSKSAVSNK